MTSTLVNAAGKQFVRDYLKHIPQPYEQASLAMRAWLQEQGHEFDPDQIDVVTLRYYDSQAVVDQRLSLPQALLSDWQGESEFLVGLFTGHWAGTFPAQPLTLVDHLPDIGAIDGAFTFNVFNGLFRRTSPPRYDSTTHLPIDVEAMQKFIAHLNFHTRFVAQLDTYWKQSTQTHAQALKVSFIAACNKQVQEGSLSDAGRQMAWQAAGLMAQANDLQVRPLNVYGYAATDLICISGSARQQVLLYLPGNASPLHEFDSMKAMKDWFAEQCRDTDKRQRLLQYFKMSDAPDGFDYSGLETALHGLAAYPASYDRGYDSGFTSDGYWPASEYVNYKASQYSPMLDGELFATITQRQRQRSYDDANFAIATNAQVTKARWRDYLVTTLNLVAPLALVVPELIPLLAIGGIAQLGLGIDQIVTGKTAEDTADGANNITFGLLNATPLVALAATRVRIFASGKGARFVLPEKVNDQWGYPMGPTRPPRLDEEAAGYFSSTEPEANHPVAQRITRLPTDARTGIRALQIDMEEAKVDLLYDTEQDAFIYKTAQNEVNPTYYQVTAQEPGLTEIDAHQRPVTNEMRMRTLRALSVDLKIPIEIPPVSNAELQPIPKQILSIWTGDKEIPDELLETVATNAKNLKKTNFPYRLYLSKADPQVYESNFARLSQRDGNLQILALEEQPFFEDFKETEYFEQYEKAIDKKNFASACDVLRYPLLNLEGGIYMDVDDTLKTLGNHPDSDTVISTTRLVATPDGLVVGRAVNNELMGMHGEYNSNMIGSHADNSTLEQLSETMRERFLANGDFYDTQPLQDAPQDERDAYARKLSWMTGPRLLNDVIDDELPRLKTLRKIAKLESVDLNDPQFLTGDLLLDINSARQIEEALATTVEIGNFHSWANN